ncbi:MAG: leucyl/phenylalanyl-tRNA--protein transferase [Candidatus Kapaibacterium sp.]
MPYNYLGTTIEPDSLTYKDVIYAYAKGYFPLGDEDGLVSWFNHTPRAILPLVKNHLNISRSLKQIVHKQLFEVKIDNNFYSVIKHCALLHGDTWITSEIVRLYLELYNKGYAHSVEAYFEGKLVGGLYGVAYRSAFFGESMFHLKSSASKVCVLKLYDILLNNNFKLFDIQMKTPVFESFGCIEVSNEEYSVLLKKALEKNAIFTN